MSALLAYAALVGAQREEQFSAILPANPSLYAYYAKSGYQTFFERDEYLLRAEQLREQAAEVEGRKYLPAEVLNRIRNTLLQNWEGAVLWDDRAFWFASEDNRAYGGRLVCTHGPAYAICRYAGEGLCEVTELMCTTEHLPKLFGAMLQEMPASNYRIRLPKGSGLLEMAGLSSLSAPEPVFCGMLRPLDGASMDQLQVGEKKPYLGLGKD